MKSQTNMLLRGIHIISWTYIFLSPLLLTPQNFPVDWRHIMAHEFFSLALFLTFYLNYLYLVPHYFVNGRYSRFLLCNIGAVIGLSGLYELMHAVSAFQRLADLLGLDSSAWPFPFGRKRFHAGGFNPFFFLRNAASLSFASACAVAARLSGRWQEAEIARSKAELGRTEAELRSLKNQISPHFLLNTLNNIYSLSAFDTVAAQSAILELSKMLRYQLYEEQGSRVSVQREVEFLQNYVALMRLRLNENVEVSTNFRLIAASDARVAPHIFISLVENAFKHGVSVTEPGHVNVRLVCDGQKLYFDCRNSLFPRLKLSHENGGIGLKLVKSRLDLNYPDRHVWEYGTNADGTEYFSRIIITL